ncbi:MAG TPA: transposase [Ktedonobacteraceae bacterium]|nr:transposase [Ktedonobacteraceae bacterium]
MDEISKQLLTEVRDPLPSKPGTIAKQDSEYHREGVRNLFLACEPLTGWRHLQVTERRTRADWAAFVRDLVEVQYPHAEKIVLVMDNLNTHTTAVSAGENPSRFRRVLPQWLSKCSTLFKRYQGRFAIP